MAATLSILATPMTALAAPAGAAVPGVPTITGVSGGDHALAVRWSAGSGSGTSFVARVSSDHTKTCTASVGDFPPNTCTIDGLTNGRLYGVEVAAVNGDGTSSFATSAPSITQMPTEVPRSPSNISTVVGSTVVKVSWTAPTPNTANPSYAVSSTVARALDATTGAQIPAASCTTSGTSCIVPNLSDRTPYRFSVTARNVIGLGLPAVSASTATPDQVPTTVPHLGGPPVTPGDGAATVHASTTQEDISTTSFLVTASPGGRTCSVPRVGTDLASCTVTGLSNGTAYDFTVVPVNANGPGLLSGVTTPAVILGLTTPGAVKDVTVTPGDAAVVVTWTAPDDDGGTPVTSYQAITHQGGAGICAVNAPQTSCAITGLFNGTALRVSVYAINDQGGGTIVDASGTVTPLSSLTTVPDVPTAVSATASPRSASVSWTAPTYTGGAAIDSYTVTATPGGATCTSSTTSCTYSTGSLTDGTAYTFAVTATNAVGTGGASLPSAPKTPVEVPASPTAVTAVAGNRAIDVTWTNPTDDGGSAITGYTATTTAAPTASCSVTAASGRTSCRITGLTNGAATTVRVVATNAVGSSAPSSASSSVTPLLVPLTPAYARAYAGDGQVLVKFPESSDGAGHAATSYTAAVIGDPSKTCSYTPVYPNTDQCFITGLTNGVTYEFSLVANNNLGQSLPVVPAPLPGGERSMVATPAPSIGTPDHVAASTSDGSAAVYFHGIPDDAAVVYSVFVATYPEIPDPITNQSMQPKCQFGRDERDTYECLAQNLGIGTLYNVVVMATNASLAQTVSPPTVIFPHSVPSAPASVSVSTGNSSARVSWTPGGDGGYPLVSTTVTAQPGGATCTVGGSSTSCTISGLSPMTTYTFSVVPSTVIGTGPATTASAEVGSFALSGAGFAAEVMAGVYEASGTGGATWGYFVDLGLGSATNALAYEPADGFMYFIDNPHAAARSAYRLGVNGQTELVGKVAGLAKRIEYTGGAIDPATGSYYVSGSSTSLLRISSASGALVATPVALPPGAQLGADFIIRAGKVISFTKASICRWTLTDASTPAVCSAVRSTLRAQASGSRWLSRDGSALLVRQNVNARVVRFSGILGSQPDGVTVCVRNGLPSNPLRNDGASVVPAEGNPTRF